MKNIVHIVQIFTRQVEKLTGTNAYIIYLQNMLTRNISRYHLSCCYSKYDNIVFNIATFLQKYFFLSHAKYC